MLERMNKADRVIVILAFLIFASSLLLLFSDFSLFQALDRYRGEPIGYIAEKNGDVRFKSAETIVWGNPNKFQNIIYNDSVFVGEGSSAVAKLGNSQLEINQNSLVVFRKEQEANFLNMSYGELWGKLGKGDKIVIDNGKGSPIEITAQQKSEIVFKKSNTGKIQIQLSNGNAKVDINGKKVKLKPNAIIKASSDSDQVSTSTPDLIVDESFGNEYPALVIEDLPQEKEVYHAPYILQPYTKEVMVRNRKDAEVAIEFQLPSKAEYIWYQIYGQDDSSRPLVDGSILSGSLKTQLVDGNYKLRAASIYPEKKQSPWTEFIDFSVRTEIPELELVPLTPRPAIHISNKIYHPRVYKMQDRDVSKYLAKSHPELRDYFKDLEGHQFEIITQGKILLVEDNQVPAELIYPGRRSFQYQLVKDDHENSPLSKPILLEVVLDPPKKIFSEVIQAPAPGAKVAKVEVEWTPLLFADRYEIELQARNQKPRKLVSKSTKATLTLSANVNYTWKTRALNKQGVPISNYSEASEEYVPYVEVIIPSLAENAEDTLENEAKDRLVASEENFDQTSITETLETPKTLYEANGFFAWIGSGYNFTNYKQRVENVGAFDDNNLAGPSMYAEAGYRGRNGYGGVFSYKSTPGEVRLMDTELKGTKYQWTTMSLEGLFEKQAPSSSFSSGFSYGLRAGMQKHELPYIHQLAVNDLSLRKIDMQTASLGFLTRLRQNRLNYHWSMRYQYPLSTSASGIEGFDVKTKFAFDGLLGLTYHLTEQWMLGWFWYGQWHEYDLKYIQNNNFLTGSQSLFYSNMDFRLGFDF